VVKGPSRLVRSLKKASTYLQPVKGEEGLPLTSLFLKESRPLRAL
jgi:hypothetical protein